MFTGERKSTYPTSSGVTQPGRVDGTQHSGRTVTHMPVEAETTVAVSLVVLLETTTEV